MSFAPACTDPHAEGEIAQFFALYGAALQSRDVQQVLPYLSVPMIVRRAHLTEFIRDTARLIEYHCELFDQYEAAGVAELRYKFVRGRRHGSSSASAALVWTMVTVGGSEVEMSEVGYTLERNDDRWQIVAVDFASRDARARDLGW